MKIIEISTAFLPLREYVQDLGDEPIVLTSSQKPVAAIVSLKKVDRESLALSISPEFMGIIQKARKDIKTGHKLSLKEMKQELA